MFGGAGSGSDSAAVSATSVDPSSTNIAFVDASTQWFRPSVPGVALSTNTTLMSNVNVSKGITCSCPASLKTCWHVCPVYLVLRHVAAAAAAH